jgi:hypothetical protein
MSHTAFLKLKDLRMGKKMDCLNVDMENVIIANNNLLQILLPHC